MHRFISVIIGFVAILTVFILVRSKIANNYSTKLLGLSTRETKISDINNVSPKIDSMLHKNIAQAPIYNSKYPNKFFFKRIMFSINTDALPSTFSEVKKCSKIGDIYTGFIELNKLSILAQRPEVDSIESGANCIIASENRSLPFLTNIAKNFQVFKKYTHKKNKEPIIGIIEKEINPNDCIIDPNSDLNPKILFYWNQSQTDPMNCPFEITNSYGTEYSSKNINFSNFAKRRNHHAVTIIKKIHEIAKNKNFEVIIVSATGSEASILDAISYIKSKAKFLDRPLIINMSLGTKSGSHDGHSLFEKAVTFAASDGTLIVTSAGNDISTNHHAEFTNNTYRREPLSIEVMRDRLDKNVSSVNIELWFGQPFDTSISIIGPDSQNFGPVFSKQTRIFSNEKFVVSICNNVSYRKDQNHIFICIETDSQSKCDLSGVWNIVLNNSLDNSVEYDAWTYSYGSYKSKFLNFIDYTETITSPGTTRRIITVGAGLPEGKPISLGPTRDGRNKPEIWCPFEDCSSYASAKVSGYLLNLMEHSDGFDYKSALLKLDILNSSECIVTQVKLTPENQ